MYTVYRREISVPYGNNIMAVYIALGDCVIPCDALYAEHISERDPLCSVGDMVELVDEIRATYERTHHLVFAVVSRGVQSDLQSVELFHSWVEYERDCLVTCEHCGAIVGRKEDIDHEQDVSFCCDNCEELYHRTIESGCSIYFGSGSRS